MKHVIAFFGLFMLLTLSTSGQGRWSIAPAYGYNLGYEQFTYQSNDKEFLQFTENTKGSSAGLTTHYAISPQWDVSVGIHGVFLASTALYHYNQTNHTFAIQGTHSYVQLPVLINYRLSQKRLTPYFSGGALFSNRAMRANSVGINTSVQAGIGIDYQLSPKLSLLIQPTGSYLLTRPKDNATSEYNPYHSYIVSLQTQLMWRF
jgi:hypothetical protein